MLCGNTLHRLIMPATHLFGVERAGTTLNMGGTESGLSFGYHGNPSPSGDDFLFPVAGEGGDRGTRWGSGGAKRQWT